jgi:hypothetical protein
MDEGWYEAEERGWKRGPKANGMTKKQENEDVVLRAGTEKNTWKIPVLSRSKRSEAGQEKRADPMNT